MTANESLRDLCARVDLVSLVASRTPIVRVQGRATTFRCPHPDHADQHPSFVVTTTANGRQVWRCFSQCARFGDAIDLLSWLDGCTKGEAANRLRAWLGDPTPTARPLPRSAAPQRAEKPRPNVGGPECDRAFLLRYAEQRGWPASMIERFSLSVVTDAKGRRRIRHPFLVPSPDGGWHLAYWQDRGTRDASPRWLSSAGRSPVLYNLPSLASDHVEAVVICEGPADTITATAALSDVPSVDCVGVPGVSAWRPEWAQIIGGLRVVVAADPDDAGRKLEESVRRTMTDPITLVHLAHGDLTDTAKHLGLGAVADLLLTACAIRSPQPVRDPIALLLAAFPGSRPIDDPERPSHD